MFSSFHAEQGPAKHFAGEIVTPAVSSLRQRILDESRAFARGRNGTPTRRKPYARPPKFPGMAAFGTSNGKLYDLPIQRSTTRDTVLSQPDPKTLSPPTVVRTLDEYHTGILNELDSLIERSRDTSAAYIDSRGTHEGHESIHGQSLDSDQAFSFDLDPESMFSYLDDTQDTEPCAASEYVSEMTLLAETQSIYMDLMRDEQRLLGAVSPYDWGCSTDYAMQVTNIYSDSGGVAENLPSTGQGCCQLPYTEQKILDSATAYNSCVQPSGELSTLVQSLVGVGEFSMASQHPNAPEGLRKLTSKYNMPERTWDHSIRRTLDFVRRQYPYSWEQMFTFVDTTSNWLDQLREDVPALTDSWNMIDQNLHQYLLSLRSEGFDVPESYLGRWSFSSTPSPSSLYGHTPTNSSCSTASHKPCDPDRFLFPPHSSSRQYPPGITNLYDFPVAPLKDSVLCFMTGWANIGTKIAKNSVDYGQTFKFLAWAGAMF